MSFISALFFFGLSQLRRNFWNTAAGFVSAVAVAAVAPEIENAFREEADYLEHCSVLQKTLLPP